MKRIHLFLCLTILLLALAPVSGFGQQLTLAPSTLTLSAQSGGSEVSQRVSVVSSSPVGFLVVTQPQVTWLRVDPATGSTPNQSFFDVFVNPANLPVGTYSTTLIVYGGPAPATLPVTLVVGTVGVTPSALSFSYTTNGVIPGAQFVNITNPIATNFTAVPATTTGGNWLQVAPSSGTTPAAISVALNSAVIASLAVGTYSGSVNITPISTVSGVTISVPVTLVVTGPLQVTASPQLLSFGYQLGGSNNVVQQTLTLSTNSASAVSYGLATQVNPNPAGINWITANPTGGVVSSAAPASIAVSISPGTLPQGTYEGRITIFTPGAIPANQEVVVRLVVSALPLLNVPTATLTFNYQVGTGVPPPQTVTPTSTSGAIQYTITAATANGGNWLTVPVSSTTPNGFQVSVNPAGLPAATYTATITVTGINVATAAQQIPVVLKVSNDPVVIPSLSSLSFAYQIGQVQPAMQAVRLTSSTGLPLSYSVSTANPWIVLGGQTSGGTEGVFTVQANTANQAAGTYDGTITITAVNPQTGVAVPNSPISIPVKFYVSASPLLLASPGALSFTAQVSGGQPGAQTISLNSTSATEQVLFRTEVVTDNGGTWLFAGPQTGSTPGQLVVSVVPILLSAGTYTGTIRVIATTSTGTALANSPVLIPVTLTMTSGSLSVSPASLSFSQTSGGAAPAAQTLNITSSGLPATFSVAGAHGSIAIVWINLSATSGTTPGSVNVSVDASRLTPGTYNGTVTVTAPGLAGSPVVVPITFTVNAGTIVASPASLNFAAAQGGSQPSAQTVNVTATVGGALNYSVELATTTGGSWLSANPTSGSTPGSVSISANPSGLSAGTYQGSVTIKSPGATGSPIIIPVTLTVAAPLPLNVSPTSLTFTYITGLTVPPAQNIAIASPGGSASFSVAVAMSSGSGWLSATPSGGNAPANIAVSVSPQNLAAGTYNGAVTITSPNATAPVTVNVTLNVQAIPPPSATNIVNSASFAAGPVAPGEIITIGGSGMANAGDSFGLQLDGGGSVATKLGDTRVLFDGNAAPLIYVSPNQVNAVVPYSVAGRVSTRIQVEYKSIVSSGIDLRVVDASPAIYTQNQSGTGPGVIANQNYSINTGGNPAAKGSVVTVIGTGEGQTSPAGVTGSVTPNNGSGLKRPLLNVTATVGGRPARVLYAGSAPGFLSGAFQVNVEIPTDVPSGAQPIVIQVGSNSSQPGVTVAVQ